MFTGSPPPSEEGGGGATDAFTLRGFRGNVCVLRQRTDFFFLLLFSVPKGGCILSCNDQICVRLCVCECVSAASRGNGRGSPGAGPNKSADRLRRVGEHGCQRADVNRAQGA